MNTCTCIQCDMRLTEPSHICIHTYTYTAARQHKCLILQKAAHAQSCVNSVCINCMAMCAYGCRYIAMCMYCYATYGYDKIHMWIANGHTIMYVVMLACVSVHMCNIAWSHGHMHSHMQNKMQCHIGERSFRNVISHFWNVFFYFFKLLENVCNYPFATYCSWPTSQARYKYRK